MRKGVVLGSSARDGTRFAGTPTKGPQWHEGHRDTLGCLVAAELWGHKTFCLILNTNRRIFNSRDS